MTALAAALRSGDPGRTAPRHGVGGLAGTGALVRLALRRDRVVLPVWLLGVAGLAASFAAMTSTGFDTPEELATEAALMASTPAVRMTGLMSGGTLGGYAMARGYVTLAVLAGLMSVFAVVRHTRQNEELGRAELVGAAVVGRYAGLAAAVLVTIAANVLLIPLVAAADVVGGLPGDGAWTAGAAVAVVGLSFAGVAAVTAQLSPSTRAASGLAGATLGVAFVLSGVGNMLGSTDASGDVRSAWPAWLSPIGWGQQMRAYDTDLWWPALLGLALLAALLGVAAVLIRRRDVGRGLLAERRGRAGAGRSLASPLALTFRLQRPVLVGWCVAMVAFGALFGALGDQVVRGDETTTAWYEQMGGTEQVAAAFRTSMLLMVGMAVAAYTIQVLLRMRGEEAEGRLEAVLAAGVTRVRWALGNGAVAVGGTALLMVVFAVAMGATAGDAVGDVVALCGAGLVHAAAPVVLGAVVVAVVGLVPRLATTAGWGTLLAAVLLGPLFGPDLGAPGWLQRFSPFTSVPKVPAVDVAAGPLLALAAVAVGLGVVGVVALRRRDLRLPS